MLKSKTQHFDVATDHYSYIIAYIVIGRESNSNMQRQPKIIAYNNTNNQQDGKAFNRVNWTG